ncbi:MAG: diaminopimelate epimerase [bacterium]
MADIPFTMYSGAGNLFVVVDAFNNPTVFGTVKMKALAQTVSNRKGPIGSDGMIVLGRSGKAPFMMNFYNPDGSFGALCGNGARCAVQAAVDFGVVASPDTAFEVLGELVRAEDVAGQETPQLRVYYNDPKKIKLKFKLSVGGDLLDCSYVDLGSQHGVIFYDSSIKELDVPRLGTAVRNHQDFQPLGVNANFAHIESDEHGEYIRIRTFERGVEGETLACGTGCMATAISAYGLKKISSLPIRLKTQSGEFVKVNFTTDESAHVKHLSLEGSAIRGKSGIVTVEG